MSDDGGLYLFALIGGIIILYHMISFIITSRKNDALSQETEVKKHE